MPVAESLFVLRQAQHHPGQYAALAIACLSCDDVDGIVDLEFDRILTAWNAE